MRGHMKMHLGLLAAITVIFGLQAIGVTVPAAVLYLVVLACPLMMIAMMRGHDHGAHGAPAAGAASQVDQMAGHTRKGRARSQAEVKR